MPGVQPDPDRGRALTAGCVSIFALPFFIFGIVTLRAALPALRHRSADGVVLLVVGILFAIFGVSMAGITYAVIRQSLGRSRLRNRAPMQPWLWRDDWAARRVAESSSWAVPVTWLFAIVWNGITIPLTMTMFRLMFTNRALVFVVVFFPLVGVTIACAAVYVTMRRWRFGRSVCAIDRVPIPLGATFHGEIANRSTTIPESGYALVLSSIKRVVRGGGRNRTVQDDVLWQEEQRIAPALIAPTPEGVRIPFAFTVPPDGASTEMRALPERTLWRLDVSAELPGVDYKASFELPVFETSEGHSAEQVAAYHLAHRADAARHELTAESRVTTTPLPTGGVSFHVAPIRGLAALTSCVVILAILTGGIAAMLHFGVPVIFTVFFMLFELLIIWATGDVLTGSSTVSADAQSLRTTKTWLGIAARSVIEPSRIESIQSKAGTRFGSRTYFDVEAHFADGNSRTLARNLGTMADADAIAAKLWQAMGRK